MKSEHKKLERLMLFSHVAQNLSFTKAANTLGISRGYLSAQIKTLEAEMGVPLFIRSTRNVKLTQAGEQIMQGMDKIRLALLELERSSINEGQAIEGTIKITAPALFTSSFLLNITDQFRSQYPKIDFSIDCSYTSYDLNRSNFDLAFRSTQSPPQNMIAKNLLTYRHQLSASPEYFARNGYPAHINELTQHQCITAQDLSEWSFKDAKIPAFGWLQINDNTLLKQLALAGKGIVKTPDYFINDEIKSGSLKSIFDQQLSQTYCIQLIYPQLLNKPKRISTFIEYTLEYFSDLEIA